MNRVKSIATRQMHVSLIVIAAVVMGLMFAGANIFFSGGTQASAANNGNLIGIEKAKEISFKDAGVKASGSVLTKAHFDYDDGIANYDIEFINGGKEYDYEINAKSGDIMERSVEPIDERVVAPSEPANSSNDSSATDPAPQPQEQAPTQPQSQDNGVVYYDDDWDDRYDDWDDRYDDDWDDRYDDDRYDDDWDDRYDDDRYDDDWDDRYDD